MHKDEMSKILLLDKSSSSISFLLAPLRKRGFTLINIPALKEAISYFKNSTADLIVINSALSASPDSIKRFREVSGAIPKLVITNDYNLKGLSPWLKDKSAIPAYKPASYRDFEYWIKRLLAVKNISNENQKLHASLKTKERELFFFENITRILTSTLDLNKILTAIMEKAKTMIGAEGWSILLIDEEKGDLFFEKVRSKKSKRTQKLRVQMGKGIAGWVAREGIPVIAPDVSKDKRFDRKIDRIPHVNTKSLICLPVKIKDKVIGVIEIVNRDTGKFFTKADMELVMRFVDHAAMAIERASLYQKMEELTITDDVTNLFNNRYLHRAIETEIDRSNRYGPPLTVIFMDMDNFKKVNDQNGHLVGSKLLGEVAQLLLNSLRTVDIVARYGGDEFVIVLPQTPPEAGFQVAERLRIAVEQNVFLKHEGYNLRLTASLGVASYPENAKSKEELFKIADEAMYRGKFSTKNIVYAAAALK
jgi:diguanylate cyclase (GGDEF)-like protein